MNTKIKQVAFAVAILSVFSLGFFANANNASAQYAVPTCNSATLNGNIVPNGAATSVWFEWGPGSSIVYSTPTQTFYTNSNYSQVINGLQENSTYSYRAMASNTNGTSTGQTISFTTTSCGGTTTPTPTQTYSPTATISSTPSCTAPCSAVVNWTSSGVAPTTVKIYKNGSFIWNQLPNVSGSETDWSLSQGTYRYCIRAENSNWTSETGDLACSTTTVNAATAVTPTQNMSGTLTPATYSCNISSGANSCPINFSWNTINPVATSAVTSGGATVANGNSGSSSFSIPFGSKTFYLYNNSILLDQKTVSASCTSGTTWNGGICQTNVTPVQTCQDVSSTNYGGALPCTYAPQLCQDPAASNYHSAIPCTYAQQVCQDTAATNYHGALPCTYPQSSSAGTNFVYGTNTSANTNKSTNTNTSSSVGMNYVYGTNTNTNTSTGGTSTNTNTNTYTNNNPITNTNTNNNNPIINVNVTGGSGDITQICQDPSATNYRGSLPCNYYSVQVCQDQSATNYRGALPCAYYNNVQTCQDPSATNYRGISPCIYQNQNIGQQPTVVVFANKTSVPYNGTATVSWITTNATSCSASGGSIGWAGAKSIGPGSFYTGSLTGSRTYTLTCNNNFGSATDSVTINVTGQTVINSANPVTPTSLVLITSSVDRNQPIVPTIDNSRPHPGDEINYTVSYQNVGTGSITGLTLRIDLPPEVDYMFSTPNNPIVSGQTLIFNLGTLKANGQGTVTARVRVRDNIPANTNLNFPATLSYINPSGAPQSVVANVSAQVWSEPTTNTNNSTLGADVFGSGVFLPVNLLGWLVLIILILALVFLSKYTYTELKK